MKQLDFLLKIENPCEESWDAMSSTESGKYCFHCSKNVIDFTSLSDEEIIKIISKPSDKICGRLTNEQMNRVLVSRQSAPKTKLFRYIAGFFLVGAAENVIALPKSNDPSDIFSVPEKKASEIKEIQSKDNQLTDTIPYFIQGKVFDAKTLEPMAYASVIIRSTSIGIQTDLDGNFKLLIPERFLKDTLILEVTSVGYEKYEMSINTKDEPFVKQIFLKPYELIEVTTGAVVVMHKKKKWWQFRKRR